MAKVNVSVFKWLWAEGRCWKESGYWAEQPQGTISLAESRHYPEGSGALRVSVSMERGLYPCPCFCIHGVEKGPVKKLVLRDLRLGRG